MYALQEFDDGRENEREEQREGEGNEHDSRKIKRNDCRHCHNHREKVKQILR